MVKRANLYGRFKSGKEDIDPSNHVALGEALGVSARPRQLPVREAMLQPLCCAVDIIYRSPLHGSPFLIAVLTYTQLCFGIPRLLNPMGDSWLESRSAVS